MKKARKKQKNRGTPEDKVGVIIEILKTNPQTITDAYTQAGVPASTYYRYANTYKNLQDELALYEERKAHGFSTEHNEPEVVIGENHISHSPASPSISKIKDHLKAQLKAQGKEGDMMDSQLELTSIVLQKIAETYEETHSPEYKSIIKTISREGNLRYDEHPKEERLYKWLQLGMSALQASGLNYNSKSFEMDIIERLTDYEKRRLARAQNRQQKFEN